MLSISSGNAANRIALNQVLDLQDIGGEISKRRTCRRHECEECDLDDSYSRKDIHVPSVPYSLLDAEQPPHTNDNVRECDARRKRRVLPTGLRLSDRRRRPDWTRTSRLSTPMVSDRESMDS